MTEHNLTEQFSIHVYEQEGFIQIHTYDLQSVIVSVYDTLKKTYRLNLVYTCSLVRPLSQYSIRQDGQGSVPPIITRTRYQNTTP